MDLNKTATGILKFPFLNKTETSGSKHKLRFQDGNNLKKHKTSIHNYFDIYHKYLEEIYILLTEG